MPCGDRGARQSRGFFERKMLGKMHQTLGIQADLLGHHAVDGAAQRGIGFAVVGRPFDPVLHEDAAATRSPGLTRVTPGPTAVTSPAPSESGISGALTPRPISPAQDRQIAVIQRTGPHPHHGLAGTRQLDLEAPQS